MPVATPMHRLLDAAMEMMGRPSVRDRDGDQVDQSYEMAVYKSAIRLAITYEETEHLLNLMTRTRTFQEISAALKSYIISWSTMHDAVANIINEVLELGLPVHRIGWKAVLRDQRVRGTTLFDIAANYDERLTRDQYNQLRNDIVHRGWLVDVEFDDAHGEWLANVTMAQLKNRAAPPEEVARSVAIETGVIQTIVNLARSKEQQLRTHLQSTLEQFEEFAPILELELRRRCAN